MTMPMPNWPGVDAVGHAEAALGDGLEVARDGLPDGPALFPALPLEQGLDGEVGGARARRRAHAHVAVIDGLGQVRPGLRHRQLLGLEVAGVPHDAVAGSGEPLVVALGIVDGERSHLLGYALDLDLVLLQQPVSLQHLEGVGGGGPEHVGPVVAGGLLQVLDAGRRFLPQHLDLDAGVFLLEGRLDGVGRVRRVRRDDDQLVLDRAGTERRRDGQRKRNQQDAQRLSLDRHGSRSSLFRDGPGCGGSAGCSGSRPAPIMLRKHRTVNLCGRPFRKRT